MRKALLVTLEYPPQIGGVANYYYNLVQELPKDEIFIINNEKGELLYKFPFLNWLKAYFTIKKIIKEKNIEVILVGQILPLGTVALLLSMFIKIPYIICTHAMDITYPQKYPRKKWLMKKILASAEKITTVSRYTKFELLKLIDDKKAQRKIEIITPAPNITPKKFFNNDVGSLQKKFTGNKILLSVGRLVKRKGHDMVIKAMPKVLAVIPNCKYIIIGDGEYKQDLVNLIKKLNLEKNIIFNSKMINSEVAKYYELCDLFIMPSRKLKNNDVEGFGLVYVEANSFGKPVIGGKSGGVGDAVLDGKTGFLVDPIDVDMVADAIIQLFSKKELANKLGEFGKKRVEQEFTWPVKAKQLMDIL